MTAREIVNRIFEQSDLSQAEYAKRLRVTRYALWDRLNTSKSKDMTAALLSKMVSVLGYKVTVVPKDHETPSDGYDVE